MTFLYVTHDQDEALSMSDRMAVMRHGAIEQLGTPQEIFLWPYFARMPLKDLTPEQKVELFKIVTGADYRDMLDFGAYNFYRLGIGSDGTWHFFVTGD